MREGRFVVSGASGFIGAALCRRLLVEGAPVLAVSRRGTHFQGAENVTLRDYALPDLAAILQPDDRILHVAGLAHVSASTDALHRANADAVAALAQAALQTGAAGVVLLSSIAVHGPGRAGRPLEVTDTPAPANPYGASKLAGELALCRTLADAPCWWAIIRPPMVYGPDCPGNFARLLRLVAHLPLIPLGSVQARRSMVFIDNLVDALCHVACAPVCQRRVMHVRDGEDLRVGDLVHRLAVLLGRSPRVVVPCPSALLRAGAQLLGRRDDAGRLLNELRIATQPPGWSPPVSVDAALAATVAALSQCSRR